MNTASFSFEEQVDTGSSHPLATERTRLADRFMALNIEPFSVEAMTLTDAIVALVHSESGKTYKPTPQFQQAVGATIADLLANAIEDRLRYGFRPMALASFTGNVVGYKPFRSVVAALEKLSLLELQLGVQGSLTGGPRKGEATRMRAKAALFELALRNGITPGTWPLHFRQMPRQATVANPIMLRSSSANFYGRKLPGKNMRVDKSLPVVQALSRQVNDINVFIAGQDLGLAEYQHHYFVRIFGQGDLCDFNWNKGGRLYSPGKDSYQQMPSAERRHIQVNGEATLEIDIKSSFLTIYRAFHGLAFDPAADYYDIPGVPRSVAKSWVVMTFGHERFHASWPKQVKVKYRESGLGTGDLQQDHPIAGTRRRIITALPELADWPSSTVRWGELQHAESCAMVDTVHVLAMRGIVALPVHDSILVAARHQREAEAVLTSRFEHHVGVKPALSVKRR